MQTTRTDTILLNAAKALLDHVHDLATMTYPPEVIDQVNYCLIDYLGCAYAGSARSVYRKHVDDLPDGPVRLLGFGQTTDSLRACLMNGIFAHTEELDDGHRRAMMHVGAPLFSALLAAWDEHANAIDEQRFVAATVCGYQAAILLGECLQPRHKLQGFHATGTCGTVATALALGVLYDYREEQMASTLALAATSAAGLLGVLDDGSQMKPYNVGRAALDAYAAAQLGALESLPPDDILGGKRGFLRVFSVDGSGAALPFPPKGTYLIQEVFRKPYAACRHCHAPIDAARAAAHDVGFEASLVKHVLVRMYDLGVYGHDQRRPSNGSAAKMSIPFCVAAALLGEPLLSSTFTDERCNDAKIVGLAEKVTVVSDSLVTSWLPDRRGCILRIEFTDGSFVEKTIEYAKGEPENPMTTEELEQKFLTLCTSSSALPCDEAQHILQTIKADGIRAAMPLL